jgi:hypothetical protein
MRRMMSMAVPVLSWAWLGAGVALAGAAVFGVLTVRFCVDRWTASVAVAVALLTVVEAVWLPRDVPIVLPALLLLVLLPGKLAARVPMRVRQALPAATMATITALSAMWAPPLGLRPVALLLAGAAAVAALVYRRVASPLSRLRREQRR